jgi:hypothetical protein
MRMTRSSASRPDLIQRPSARAVRRCLSGAAGRLSVGLGAEPTTPADRFLSPEIAADRTQRPGTCVVSIKSRVNEWGRRWGNNAQKSPATPCRSRGAQGPEADPIKHRMSVRVPKQITG